MGHQEHSAFQFEGRWQDYAPIAFTNLLLTIVTLGVYRFWATTRTRQYLWSRTRFIDEHLEWTGTGKELLIGFLLVLVLFGIPFVLLQFGAQALALRGHVGLAAVLGLAAAASIFYLVGVARFRALRYRLSRTYWHGIRGGSDDAGIAYGWSSMWKTIVGYMPLWLLVPWSMMELWNQRWEAMGFGSERFRSEGRAGPIFKRFLLFYLAPFVIVVALAILAAAFGRALGPAAQPPASAGPAIVLGVLGTVVGAYLLLGLIAVAYYAAFLREAIGHLSLGDIEFRFGAGTRDWLMLFLGDVLLVLLTLGIGIVFLSYRHWSFFARHLEAHGEVSLGALGQSSTRPPGQGEGLLDALDIGAI